MLQRGRCPGEAVPVVLVTHETQESAMRDALDRIAALRRGAGGADADPDRAGVIRPSSAADLGSTTRALIA